ncbi:MAG: 30S ribosomal protein S5 [Promethearchaeota archaeon]
MSSLDDWVPKTKMGALVKEGRITTIDEIFKLNLPIREPEIVDILLPNLEEEVIDVNLVQRQTDAGRQSRFKATVIVGNSNGYVGIGEIKLRETGPAIRAAISHAKLNIIPVRRGCGSWQCDCGHPHTVPFRVSGKAGSVRVELLPAPKGTGLAAAGYVRTVLRLAGISDVWSNTRGHTRTTVNFAKAALNALRQTYRIMTPADWERV